jgi:hypothetical protein
MLYRPPLHYVTATDDDENDSLVFGEDETDGSLSAGDATGSVFSPLQL